MAVDQFLKLEKIKGESQDHKHKDEIDVLAWSWGLSQSGSTHQGKGSGAGKVSIQDLTITKYVDSATHALMLACCNGKHIPEALLTVRKAGEEPLEYLKITMSDVIVSSVSTGGSGGEDKLVETVSLNFGKVKVVYVPQKADGSGDAEKEMGWHIPLNKEA